MQQKLFLIDGHSLIFRMYYAFLRHPMVNSKGRDVSILYGFLKYLFEIVEKEGPTHLAVCFDPPGKTFRHQLYPEYKGTRSATPELVIEALEPLIELCEALHIPVLMIPGYEGDDVLGSMAVRSAAEGMDVYMVTPDKDFGQLVSSHIWQFRPGKSGGDDEILGPAELCAKWGLSTPEQMVDMLTICGDTADNVPGVNGVGEKGASKLLSQYGSVENIYAHLDELTPRMQGLFREAESHIALSKSLVTIKTDIPLAPTAEDMKLRETHDARVFELFEYYEFPSLKKYIRLSDGQSVSAPVASQSLSWEVVSAGNLMAKARAAGRCSIIVEAEQDNVFSRVKNLTVACAEGGKCYAAEGSVEQFAHLLSDGAVAKCGYALKAAVSLLANHQISLEGKLEDIELMHYLVNPEKSHKVEILSRSYLNVNLEEEDAQQDEPTKSLGLFDSFDAEAETKPKERFKEAVAILQLREPLMQELENLQMCELFEQVEEPLQRVLSRMERNGVRVDLLSLKNYAASLEKELAQIESRVREMAGEPGLNVSSPKQVGSVLFEKLRIDPKIKAKKDARGNAVYPTDEETLSTYADTNPIIGEILEYRGVKKLLGTYIEPFGTWIAPQDGRIHTTFNQALTATGRLSSSRPNLQNIPIRTDRGREIRKAFVAQSEDMVIISADYSQIELRLMAHFCGDENMRHAFCEGKDVHAITAAKIFNLPLDEVDDHMRRTAKTANFGIMYGISAFGLAQRLHIPRVAAKKIIEDYFAGFPSIQQWIEKTKADASANGYVQTLFGRRRYLPDINSRNVNVRSLAERNAVNAPIQGTAADIIKMAMNRVDARMRAEGMQSKMVLQIHDELLFEVPKSEIEPMMKLIREEMENVIKISVPLTVECSYGGNWLEAH